MITQNWHVLIPAYGRDYESKNQVEVAFRTGKDFEGDAALGFKLCSVRDFAKGTTVELRYSSLGKAHVVVV